MRTGRKPPPRGTLGPMDAPRQVARAERRFAAESDRWDRIYSEDASWLARAWDLLMRQNVRRRFARTFEVAGPLAGASVLDVGCGSGRYLVEAAARGAKRVLGVDVAAPMVGLARGLAREHGAEKAIECRESDLFALGLEEHFDLVIANGLFDYLPDPSRALASLHAWTRGLLVATFPDRFAFRALPRRAYWKARGLEIRLFTEAEIFALARAAGFRDARIERIGPIFLLTASDKPLVAGGPGVHA